MQRGTYRLVQRAFSESQECSYPSLKAAENAQIQQQASSQVLEDRASSEQLVQPQRKAYVRTCACDCLVWRLTFLFERNDVTRQRRRVQRRASGQREGGGERCVAGCVWLVEKGAILALCCPSLQPAGIPPRPLSLCMLSRLPSGVALTSVMPSSHAAGCDDRVQVNVPQQQR